MHKSLLPSQELLNEELRYNPETGELFLKRFKTGRRTLRAGSLQNDGTFSITINYKKYRVSRIIWKMVYGTEPNYIDHHDKDHKNNRLANLRNVTNSQNQMNSRAKNKKLPKGVFKHHGDYRAQITKDGVTKSLGIFYYIADAEIAYRKAASELFGEFAG